LNILYKKICERYYDGTTLSRWGKKALSSTNKRALNILHKQFVSAIKLAKLHLNEGDSAQFYQQAGLKHPAQGICERYYAGITSSRWGIQRSVLPAGEP
jgi:hypothetical protein